MPAPRILPAYVVNIVTDFENSISDSRDECSICLEELHNPVITACKHVFGGECIERTIVRTFSELSDVMFFTPNPIPNGNC